MISLEDYIGSEVEVEAREGDLFTNDFVGTVVGTKDNYLMVRDQDDDVWCVEPEQVKEI